MTIKPSILVAAAIAACTHPDTLVHVEVTGDATSSLDTYELRIGSETAQAEALPAIDLDVPDGMAGTSVTLEVWGLGSGLEVAYGTAMVKPTLHATTDVTVALGAIECGPFCAEGMSECMGSGTSTCTEAPGGCLAWSPPTACPAGMACTNGACGGSAAPPPVACSMDGSACNDYDACTTNDMCENGYCSGTPLCTTAPANADPVCSNGTCGFSCHTGYVNTGTSCIVAEHVFATSTVSTGDLGGLAGADATCQSLATAAGLAGTYKAWLSDSTTSAGARLDHVDGYVLADNTTIVATSWMLLTSGMLQHAIDLDERGSAVTSYGVWTDTRFDGTTEDNLSNSPDNCTSWTIGTYSGSADVEADTAFSGMASVTSTNWTEGEDSQACDLMQHLYCFQQ